MVVYKMPILVRQNMLYKQEEAVRKVDTLKNVIIKNIAIARFRNMKKGIQKSKIRLSGQPFSIFFGL